MAPGPLGGPLGVFAALYFSIYVCDHFHKKIGVLGPYARTWRQFFKKMRFRAILGHNGALAAPKRVLAGIFFSRMG